MPGETALYEASALSLESCCATKQLHMATVSLALLIGKSKIGIGPSDPKVLSGLIAAVTGGTELSRGPARGVGIALERSTPSWRALQIPLIFDHTGFPRRPKEVLQQKSPPP